MLATLCLCRPFLYFERCLDSKPVCCRSQQARYQLSHPYPYLATYLPTYSSYPSPHLATHLPTLPSISLPLFYLAERGGGRDRTTANNVVFFPFFLVPWARGTMVSGAGGGAVSGFPGYLHLIPFLFLPCRSQFFSFGQKFKSLLR